MIWRGRTVAVCASGPSMSQATVDAIRAAGLIAIVTNDTWRLFPDADVLFAANASWWNKLNPRVSPTPEEFAGERFYCESVPATGHPTFIKPQPVPMGGNSALRACHLAQERGATRILLFGVDLRDDQITHWHGLHQGLSNPNWTTFKRQRTAWEAYALEQRRPEVINCNPESGLTCFPRIVFADLGAAPLPRTRLKKPALTLRSMHGIGDNLHERAIVRELMRDYEVWMKTSWPQMYWDLVPELHLLPLGSPICWMAKNEVRCKALYGSSRPPRGTREVYPGYSWPDAKALSVLGAMAKRVGVPVGDFRLPIAPSWSAKADALLARLAPRKPLLIYRPLMAISESSPKAALAKRARNPDFAAYAELFAQIRERYFVVSLADAMPGQEWIVGHQIKADVEFHRGELDCETVMALTARAALVYCSPCFMTVLAQAVGTPLICVFGGWEGKGSFAPGGRFSPWLPIESVAACACWDDSCKHDKTINVPAAAARIERFITESRHANSADADHAREPVEPAAACAAA